MQEIIHSYKQEEQPAREAFNKQSPLFDHLYTPNLIIQYKRKRVREHVAQYIPANSSILELNAGTGEDAIYFAQQGHTVHATDIADKMQEVLRQKVARQQLTASVSTELCSFTELDQLQNKGPYDLIFSNFAGLNCTGELDKVLQSFAPLLKPGGVVTLVVMPVFCLWETLLALRGNFKTAFRRFRSKNGVQAHIEGVYFTCWYYKPSYIINCLNTSFDVLSVEGLCSLVPPSYLENFPLKQPRLYRWLTALENRFKRSYPWKYMGDYFIISLKKKN